MEVLVVGGTGTIGAAVVDELKNHYEVIIASRKNSDVQVNIEDRSSIEAMYKKIGKIDAVVSATGRVIFEKFEKLTEQDILIGINNKLMGQVNLVMCGLPYLSDQGSFTLISGLLNHDPIETGLNASLVNGALEGFLVGCACVLPRQIRINLVSPNLVKESASVYGDFFPGFDSVPVKKVALAFYKSVAGVQTGQVYKVGW